MNKLLMNKLLNTALAFSLATVVIACGSDSASGSSASSKAKKTTFVFGQGADTTSFDPAKVTDGDSLNILTATFDALLTYDTNGKLVGVIADRWEFTNGGKTLTMHIKQGLKFGKTSYWNKEDDLNADDVIYSLKRQYDENNKFYQKDHGRFSYWRGLGFGKVLSDIVKVDDYTIRFELKKPLVPFLHLLSMPFTAVLSKDYAESLYEANKYSDINLKPIGSGGFVFKSRTKDAFIKFEKNPLSSHPGHVDSLIFKVVKDNATRAAALKVGDIDAMLGLNVEDIDSLQKNENIKVYIKSIPSTGFLAFNMSKKPFNNVKVRKALSLAIDQESIIKNVYKSTGKAAKSVYPDSLPGVPDMPAFKQDIVKAKQLLKEAGFPKGFKTELWYMPVPRNYMPDAKKVAQIVQANFARIGVQAKLTTYDWGTYLKKGKGGEATIYMIGWSADIPDPDNFLYVLFSGQHGQLKRPSNNYPAFMNEEFDTLIDQARVESDEVKRADLYKKANLIMRDQMPIFPIAHANIVYAGKKSVKNLDMLINNRFNFSIVTK